MGFRLWRRVAITLSESPFFLQDFPFSIQAERWSWLTVEWKIGPWIRRSCTCGRDQMFSLAICKSIGNQDLYGQLWPLESERTKERHKWDPGPTTGRMHPLPEEDPCEIGGKKGLHLMVLSGGEQIYLRLEEGLNKNPFPFRLDYCQQLEGLVLFGCSWRPFL